MQPVWSTEDSFYWFPSTGTKERASKLKLRGVNHDRGDSARGPTADIIVADEFGTWKDPDYIVNSALRPQLQTTNGPFIYASTPPEDLGHAYYEHKGLAIKESRFIQRIIYDNASLTPERIEEIKKESGGEESPAWQREYLCKPVSNPERLVIPEYRESHDTPDDAPRPQFFNAFVGIDLGFNDFTAAIFGYWDFENRCLVIEDEVLVNGKSSEEIARACKEKEEALWHSGVPAIGGALNPCRSITRIGDNDRQQLHDLHTMCGYLVTPVRKDDKIAAITALRLRFSRNQIKIKERAKSLRYQLKVGLWNERRTDFQRGEKTGHLDAIDALVYLSRTVALFEHLNPYPQNLGTNVATHWINPETSSQGNAALGSAFRPFARGSG